MIADGDSPTPETHYGAGERLRIVVGALLELTEPQLQVICMRYWRDRTIAEAAVELGVTESAVSRMQRRALDRMRGYMRDRGIRSLGDI